MSEDMRIRGNSDMAALPLLGVYEVAHMLGVSLKTVHKLVREGRLDCVQITSRKRRFTQEQVQNYVKNHSTKRRIDNKVYPTLSSIPKKGGKKSSGVLSRQALLQEMRKCR